MTGASDRWRDGGRERLRRAWRRLVCAVAADLPWPHVLGLIGQYEPRCVLDPDGALLVLPGTGDSAVLRAVVTGGREPSRTSSGGRRGLPYVG